jgi:hypothetical protein
MALSIFTQYYDIGTSFKTQKVNKLTEFFWSLPFLLHGYTGCLFKQLGFFPA